MAAKDKRADIDEGQSTANPMTEEADAED